MTMIVFDHATMHRIQEVLDYAQKNRISQIRLAQLAGKVLDESEQCVVRFPGDDLAIVVTLEEQPCGWCWHVSFSKRDGKGMSLDSVLFILRAFGFENPKILKTWINPVEGSSAGILNMLIPEHECLDERRN